MRLFMIFIALVISLAAGIAFWLVNSEKELDERPAIVTEPGVTPAPAVQEQTILIARQDIPVGKTLDENDIDRQLWPAHLMVDNFIVDGNEGQVIDKVARTAFQKGQPLVTSFLANKNDPGFLAAQLASGKRAITIRVDEITGINGFAFPGDRVDILLSHDIGLDEDYRSTQDIPPPSSDSEEQPEMPTNVQRLPLESSLKVPLLMTEGKRSGRPTMRVTEVLVPNVRILAVGYLPTDYENTQKTPSSLTLEVTEMQAEMIRHADEDDISLALRSLDDADNFSTPRPVADADMTVLTPPSYFPHQYDRGSYSSSVQSLEEIDYPLGSTMEMDQKKDRITVIRGVQKEISGVNQ